MSGAGTLQQVCERAKLMVIAGVLLLTVGLTNRSWLLGLAGLGVLVGFGWTWHRAGQTKGVRNRGRGHRAIVHWRREWRVPSTRIPNASFRHPKRPR